MGRTLGDAFIRVRPDMSTFSGETTRGIDGVKKPVTSRMGTIAKRAGIALGAAGAFGAVAFAKSAVSLEAEYGKTMNKLQANLGAPQAQMRKLGDLAMQMGADTVFSAKDASDAMLELAKGGLSAAAIKGGALESALTLAAAGGVSMTQSAEVMGNALNTFNLRAGQSGQVAAALAGAANASSASIESIAQGLQQAGTVAADAGMSVQETTAAIAALANAGIAGSDAGTSMKTFFANLLPATKAARDAFEAYGLSSYQTGASLKELKAMGIDPISGSMDDVSNAIRAYYVRTGEATEGTAKLETMTKDLLYSTGMMSNAFVKNNGEFKGLAQIAGVLEDKFADLSGTERAAALQTLFGSDARRAATVLTKEGSEGLAKYIKATSDQDAAEKQAQAAMKGTAGALEQMSGSIETAQLAWGKAQKPLIMFGATVITQIVNGAVPHIEKFGKVLRTSLADVDTSSLRATLNSLDLSSVATDATKLADSVRSIDWSSVRDGAGSGITDALSVFGVTVKFVANNLDLLAKALPFLVGGFVAYKAAQLGANAAQTLSIPIKIADIVATRAQTRAMNGFVAAQKLATGSTAAGTVVQAASNATTGTSTKLTLRDRAAKVAHAAASRIAAIATGAMTLAQKGLNVAMRANPIGIVITVLAALAAATVLAYKKSDTFRRVVDNAWLVIRTSVKFAWERVIKPALSALWSFIDAKLMPVIRTLWSRVVKPVFGWIGDKIRDTWNVVKPILSTFGNFISDKVAPKVRAGVEAIGNAWDKIKQLALRPIQFVVETVINKGLIGAFNWVSGKVGGPRIGTFPVPGGGSSYSNRGGTYQGPGERRASGGVLPGYTPGVDVHHFESPTAGRLHLSGGEAIMRPEFTRAVGGKRGVDALNKKAIHGQLRNPDRSFFLGGVMPMEGATSVSRHSSGYPWAQWAGDLNGYGDDTGKAARAWKAGTVASIQALTTSYGKNIRMNHAGQSSLYAHLNQFSARPGQRVSAGQKIGEIGSTGNSSGPHLHFEVKGGNVSGGTAVGDSNGAAGPSMPGWAQNFLGGAVGWLKDRMNGALGAISTLFGNNDLSKIATAVPSKMIDSVADFLTGKVNGAYSSPSAGTPGSGTMNAQGLVPVMAQAMAFAKSKWPALSSIGGYSNRNIGGTATKSDHAYGKALDFMTYSNTGLGNDIASYFTGGGRNRFNVENVIWNRRITNPGRGWQWGPYTGSSPHTDHVHIDTFDQGGEARGKGYLPKATIHPERVLSPRQTDLHDRQTYALEQIAARRGSTERIALTITNWEQGTGYMERITDSRYDEHRALQGQYQAVSGG